MTGRGRRTVVALGATVLALAACGGGDRDLGRADTAALLSDSLAALDADSTRLASGVRDSSAVSADSGADSGADSAAATSDSADAVEARVVLRADSVAGDVLYHERGGCLTCHALNGAGVAGLGPSLRDSAWLHGDGSPEMIERVTREGVARPKVVSNRMPGYAGRLSEREIRRIAAYVFAISHANGTVADTVAPVETDSAAGGIDPEP